MKNTAFIQRGVLLLICSLSVFFGCDNKESESISPNAEKPGLALRSEKEPSSDISADADPSGIIPGQIEGKQTFYRMVVLDDLNANATYSRPVFISIIEHRKDFYFMGASGKYHGSGSVDLAREVDFGYHTNKQGKSFLCDMEHLSQELAIDYPEKNTTYFKLVKLTPIELLAALGDKGKNFIEEARHKADSPYLYAEKSIQEGDILFAELDADKTKPDTQKHALIRVLRISKNPNRVTLGVFITK